MKTEKEIEDLEYEKWLATCFQCEVCGMPFSTDMDRPPPELLYCDECEQLTQEQRDEIIESKKPDPACQCEQYTSYGCPIHGHYG